jgi:hypothetical protein
VTQIQIENIKNSFAQIRIPITMYEKVGFSGELSKISVFSITTCRVSLVRGLEEQAYASSQC